jgi:hypothetical protein
MKIVLEDCIEYSNELGQLHREDGPALEYTWCPEHNRYYIDGKHVPSF